MRQIRTREVLTLFLGDLVLLFLSLWMTLAIRYGEFPSTDLFLLHVRPFTLLFIAWLLIFFITGLYDRHTMVFRMRLPERIFRVQFGNVIVAVLFFFLVPVFGIAPKTNLFIYLIVSSVAITWWRLWLYPRISKRHRSDALIVGGGSELKELMAEVNKNERYPFVFTDSIAVERLDGGAISERIFAALRNSNLTYVVVDLHHRKIANILPHLYKPIFSNVQCIDLHDLYEEIFERFPLSILGDPLSIEGLTKTSPHWYYAASKRLIDIISALAMGVITVIAAPFVWLTNQLEKPGPLFIAQHRLGRKSSDITVYKFRSMDFNDRSSSAWVGESGSANTVTKVGKFLRHTSLDEFPQFLNLLRGELSLIGPRSDIEGLGKRLANEIPFYDMRYVITPGITGWAQINQQYEQGNISPQSIEETKMRLAYDFYYIKNRSLTLDLIIALKTLKRMVFRLSSW